MLPVAVRWTKRTVDLLGASLLLLATTWLLPLIAIAIVTTSRGPVFYRQRRVGAMRRLPNGRFAFEEFDMFKFRTMRADAEEHTGAVLAAEGDPRVTSVGRFLRKTRLDELPQLINVLRGQMSLIGPRPERRQLLENLVLAIPYFEERMRGVKPGITGLAQISLGYAGRAPEGSPIRPFEPGLVNPYGLENTENAPADDMRMKLLYDLAYVASLERLGCYLRMESLIIVKTPWIMLRGLGR